MEGRVITVEYDKFYLMGCYIPNSGQKLERLEYRTKTWDKALRDFILDLEKTKPVVYYINLIFILFYCLDYNR